jgi:MFS family permease
MRHISPSAINWNDRSNIAVAPRRPRAAFVLLGGTQAALILAITVVVIPLPAIQRDFGINQVSLALVSQAYGLAFSGLLLLGGRLADVLGHRRAFRTGVAVFGVASAVAALAPDLGVLLAARFAQGSGAAMAAPAAMALLGPVFPDPVRRSRALAVWGSLAVIGANTGTLLSGLAVTWASWRWAFAVPVAVAVAVAATAPRLLPPGPLPVRQHLDVPGALLATAGLGGLSYGLAMSSDHPWRSASVAFPLLGAALAAVAFVAVEARVPAPLLPLGFLASARRGSALAAVLLCAAASAGATFVLSLYFQQVRGYSTLETTGAFLPFLLVIASGRLGGRLMGRLGPRVIAPVGLGLTAAGLLLLGEMGTRMPYAGVPLAGLLVFPLGLGLALSGAVVASMDGVPRNRAALASGVVNTAMETGPSVGVAAMVAVAGARARPAAGGVSHAAVMASGYALSFTVSGIAFAGAAAVAAAVALRTRRRSAAGVAAGDRDPGPGAQGPTPLGPRPRGTKGEERQ